MEAGITTGLIAAGIVWALGYTLVRPSLTQHDVLNIGRAIVMFMRSGLFIASVVVLAVLLISAISSGSFAFFTGFAPAYVIGVTAYFFVRYRVRINIRMSNR